MTGSSAPPEGSGSFRRGLAAAVLTALMLVAAVPGARASIVRLIGVLQGEPPVVATEPPSAPAPVQVDPIDPVPAVLEGLDRPVLGSSPPEDEARSAVLVRASGLEFPSAPRVLDLLGVEALLQEAYPVVLQERGVGGTVDLRMWVDSMGRGEQVSVARGSGVEALDQAAQDVALRFEFEPAMLGGRSVGTWIEFSVRFEPDVDEEGEPGRLDHRIEP